VRGKQLGHGASWEQFIPMKYLLYLFNLYKILHPFATPPLHHLLVLPYEGLPLANSAHAMHL